MIVALNLVPERREVRDPIPHEVAVSDPQFVRTMSSVFGNDVKPGHRIETLRNGDEIFQPMLEAIAQATDAINFLTYIYWSGEIEVLQGARFNPEQKAAGEVLAQHVKSSRVGGSRSMHQMMLMALSAANSHVRIAMGYFAPDDVIIRQMLDARKRGVEIDVLIPGDEIDVPLVRRASRHIWGPMLEAGIRIHEYQPTNFHAKLIVVDEHWTTIGSANFDERSFRLNDESILMFTIGHLPWSSRPFSMTT